MIIVNIFNGMEIELTSNEGNYSDNVKIFRHYYYAKMCNLLGCRNLTKEVVSSITAPDFICTSVNIQGNGFAELRFERNIPSANTNNEQVINALPKQEPTVINVAEKEYIDYTGEKVNETLTKKKIETVTSTTTTAANNTATHNTATNTATSTTATPEKRGRGRPKKIKPEQTTAQTTVQADGSVSTEPNVEAGVESTAEATETV